MKKKLLLFGAVAVLLGAGGGLYATGGLGHEIETQAADVAAALTSEKSYFVDLDPLTVPVAGSARLRSGVLLRVSLEVPGIGDRNDVTRLLPRLNDALLREFYARPAGVPDGSDFIDVEQARARIKTIVDTVLGAGKVKAVLVESAVPMG